MKYGDALQEVVTSLRNAGIPATTEMAQAQLPGALVVPGTLTFDKLSGYEEYEANAEVYLVTSNKGTVQSLNDLQELLVKFGQVYTVPGAEPVQIPLKNVGGADPCPALLINLELQVTKE